MISKLILLSFVLLCLSPAFAQERIWMKQTKISEVITFEKEINPNAKISSGNISLSKEYYPLADKYKVSNPAIVQRDPLKYLPVNAEYFFTPADSILRLVSYDWEKDRYGSFLDKQKMWREETKKLDIYNQEYERIKVTLLSQFGVPNTADTGPKELDSNGSKYLNKKTIWETNSFYAELNMIFAPTTYRIRLTMYWKN
jgi:hypothetical protein